METLENIIKHWEKDSVIDSTDPSKEILRIPTLHSKYLKFMTEHKLASKRAMSELNTNKRLRWEYYNGKLSQEQLKELKWEPFQFTLKSDISIYLESDEILSKIVLRKSYHDEAASFCEAILKELGNRTWQLREHMTHERFIHGSR